MNITLPLAAPVAPVAHAPAILAAANHLLGHLERGERIDAAILRSAMETAFGASDSSGAWNWKAAYDACEVATVLFLRKYGRALFRKAVSPVSRLSALSKIAGLLPTHTRRSEESQAFQQFSTPVPLALASVTAAAIMSNDIVLEPSAGTGLRHPGRDQRRYAPPQRTGRGSRRSARLSFRRSPSRASTPRKSTIISHRAPCHPWC